VALEAARFESDAVSLRAPSLAQPSSSYMSLAKTLQETKHPLCADDLAPCAIKHSAWGSSKESLSQLYKAFIDPSFHTRPLDGTPSSVIH